MTFKDLTYVTRCPPLAETEPCKQKNSKNNGSSSGNEPSNWSNGKRMWEFLYVNVKLIDIQTALNLHYTLLTETSAYWIQVLTLQGSAVTEIKPRHPNYVKLRSQLCKRRIWFWYRWLSVHIEPANKDCLNNQTYWNSTSHNNMFSSWLSWLSKLPII